MGSTKKSTAICPACSKALFSEKAEGFIEHPKFYDGQTVHEECFHAVHEETETEYVRKPHSVEVKGKDLVIFRMCTIRLRPEQSDEWLQLADDDAERRGIEENIAFNNRKREDFRRIAACLNFFQGVSTEEIEDMVSKKKIA